jgi:hypothetical protein
MSHKTQFFNELLEPSRTSPVAVANIWCLKYLIAAAVAAPTIIGLNITTREMRIVTAISYRRAAMVTAMAASLEKIAAIRVRESHRNKEKIHAAVLGKVHRTAVGCAIVLCEMSA